MGKIKDHINQLNKEKAGIITILALLTWYMFCLPSTLFDTPYSTLVSDQDVNYWERAFGEWTMAVPPTTVVPDKYVTCLIQFEDRGFVSSGSTLFRSLVHLCNVKARKVVSGGSTITMHRAIDAMRTDLFRS